MIDILYKVSCHVKWMWNFIFFCRRLINFFFTFSKFFFCDGHFGTKLLKFWMFSSAFFLIWQNLALCLIILKQMCKASHFIKYTYFLRTPMLLQQVISHFYSQYPRFWTPSIIITEDCGYRIVQKGTVEQKGILLQLQQKKKQ